jgi:hypothetical protein
MSPDPATPQPADVRSTAPIRHGAYLCLRVPPAARDDAARADVEALAGRLGLRNEFAPGGDHPPEAVAFLRRVGATPGDLADEGLLGADAIVHVASETAAPVADFCAEMVRLLGPEAETRLLSGVVRPTLFTGTLMHNFAYAHRVLQQPGEVMPNAFLLPTSKTAGWWEKGWMERHTYFLPRYDDAGRKTADGHPQAAEAGIASLMRRTYKNAVEPAPPGAYDFVNYFECADAAVPVFHAVCASLRDVARNPEWRFVREGPTWQGRRVATWGELFG